MLSKKYAIMRHHCQSENIQIVKNNCQTKLMINDLIITIFDKDTTFELKKIDIIVIHILSK